MKKGSKKMKALMRLVCGGCGYRYDPKADIRVYDFIASDGEDYVACEKCLERLGALKAQGREQEVKSLMEKFKVIGWESGKEEKNESQV